MQGVDDRTETLTEAAAGKLLQEEGYGMSLRFDHIHAMTGTGEELHICRVSELASMNASRFLACLEEAKKQTYSNISARMQ